VSEGAGDIGERRHALTGRRIVASLHQAALFLRDAFLAERERWALWIPALLGGGIGLYFMLTVEPAGWVGPVAIVIAALLVLIVRRHAVLFLPAIALLIAAIGFADAQLQTWLVAAPVLERQIGPVRIEGRVVEIDPLPEGYRIVVAPRSVERLDAARLPLRLRIKVTRGGDDLLPGEYVALRAILYPPPAPAMPGAYDFQRRAFFDRLGGVGFAVAPVERREAPDGVGPSSWQTAIAALRSAMTERILAALPGRTGGVAAAIITGQTHAIPEADAAAFRDAGLAHILVFTGRSSWFSYQLNADIAERVRSTSASITDLHRSQAEDRS
jgi:competence protein ComEC